MPRVLFITAIFLVASIIAAPTFAQGAMRKRVAAERNNQRGVPYAGNEEAMRWADEAAERRGLDREWTRRAVQQAQYLPVVARLMQPAPAGTAKNWRVYRSRFIDATRIGAGVKFWSENRELLERAQQEYGVPPEIIVGILGVETIYGQQTGNFRVIDALATLAFNFPESHPRATERRDYFRGELEHFLALQYQRHADPTRPLGSYAGAVGMPQFMPSSWARWGVDFDADGRVDLTRSTADVIGSVANYFKSYGWRPGMPTHYPVSFDVARLDKDALLAPDILPTFSVASFMGKGAVLEGAALQHPGPLALVELQNGGAEPEYVAGTENFYVITRYNWSSYYAMAVIELGREVKKVIDGAVAPDQKLPAPAPVDALAVPPETPATTVDRRVTPEAASDAVPQAEPPPVPEPQPSAPVPATEPDLHPDDQPSADGADRQ